MLPYYAARFPTVEINYTFYRMPNEKLVSGWAAQTPEPYRLTLKAPRRITHDSRLKNTGDLVQGFCRVAMRSGQARCAAVPVAAEPEEGHRAVRRVPGGAAAARLRGVRVPPRRPGSTTRCSSGCGRGTWRSALPTARSCPAPVQVTADYAYFRLRDEGYTPDDIARWADTIARETSACKDVFVYFKHEDEGKGPEFAQMLMRRLGLP